MPRLTGLLLALLILPGTLPAQERQATPDYYPMKPGARWTYKLTLNGQPIGQMVSQLAKLETLDGVELARLECTSNGQAISEHLKSTPQGVFRHRYNGDAVTPPIRLVTYPVKAGDKWEIDSTILQERIKGTAVVSLEEIQVAAGTFKTVKVQFDATVNGTQQLTTTYWFADGVGLIKQAASVGEASIVQELEKYELRSRTTAQD